MMAIATAKTLLTPEEYLVKERAAEFKSEYRNGQIVMMPGASREHVLIAGNIFGELYIQLLDRTCEVYANDMRVKVSESGLYTYPDVIVVCDEPRFEDGHFDTLLNPTVIVEVLSPSTEDYDRQGKFYSYQTLESLQEYILVSQDDVCVEQYIRQDEDWKLMEYRSLDDVMINASIECQLAIRAIYAKVKLRVDSITMEKQGKMWQSLPNAPGVYLMKASDGSPIYIGKAVNLRNRVRSYFQQSGLTDNPLTAQMMRYVTEVDFIVTSNEIEALILENNLIKSHQPRYNVKLKDDKRYPFLRVTTNEPFPRIMITRKTDNDGTRYFGPFVRVRSTRQVLKQLTKLFPIRTCTLPLEETNNKYRACLDYHIGRCPAPCANLINVQDYKKIVRKVCQFLGGNTNAVVKDLQQQMKNAANSLDFEAAARYRDMLNDVQQAISSQQSLDNVSTVDEDVIGIATAFQHDLQSRLGDVACVQVLHVRDGKLLEREHYYLNDVHPEQIPIATGAFVSQYYQNAVLIPKTIVIPSQIESVELIEKWLSEKRGNKVSLHVPRAGRLRRLQTLAMKNAEVLLIQREQSVVLSSDVDPALVELQELLDIKHPLRRIEAYDISNLGDRYAVGSMVVIQDGKPANSEYRQFRIKDVDGQNDYAMMQEVVTRRFRRAETGDAKFSKLPDLMLIDGGKGQLNAVQTALQSFADAKIDPVPTQIPLIALAKRIEEIYVPGKPEPIILREDNPTLHLIQRLRDEAHRFAITYHRKLRHKALSESVLDEIPNIGPKRKQALLQQFGSIDAIRKASLDELLSVEGIPRNVAENIRKNL